MYQTQILKNIIVRKDVKALSKIVPLSKHIFPTEDVHSFFEFLYSYVTKYGDIPTENYINNFLAGERNSPVSDVWNSLAEINASPDDTLAMVELQAIYSTRSKVMGLSHGVLNNLKLSNNSDSTAIVTDFKMAIESVVSTQQKLYTKQEALTGERALYELKMYHEQSNARGYFLSKYGLPFIDESWGGMERSGFIGILASAKQYKSTLMRLLCYKQIMQGISVGVITLEMPMEAVREHFYVLHANNHEVWGFSRPNITVQKVKQGLLTKTERDFYYQAVEDFVSNPLYGKLIIEQPMSTHYTKDDFFLSISDLKRNFGCKVIAPDYLTLISPKLGRVTVDDYNDMIMETRYKCLQEEVTVITPIQANRDGKKFSTGKVKDYCYDLTHIYMYSAFEKGCTSILSSIQTDEMRALNQVAVGAVVNREMSPFVTTNLIINNSTGFFYQGEAPTNEQIISIIDEIEI